MRADNQLMTEDRTTYHHGKLREAALAAARVIVEEQGHDALSMRELAEKIKVAPSALYRHFSNRIDLLMAIANETHRELGLELSEAVAAHSDPWDALETACHSYLSFSLANPSLFRMMYDPELMAAPDADARLDAQQAAYGVLLELFHRALPNAPPAQLRLRMVSVWSTLYGYASTQANRILHGYMKEGLTNQEMERAVLAAALRRPAGAGRGVRTD